MNEIELYQRVSSRDILFAVVDISCSCILICFYAAPSHHRGDAEPYCSKARDSVAHREIYNILVEAEGNN